MRRGPTRERQRRRRKAAPPCPCGLKFFDFLCASDGLARRRLYPHDKHCARGGLTRGRWILSGRSGGLCTYAFHRPKTPLEGLGLTHGQLFAGWIKANVVRGFLTTLRYPTGAIFLAVVFNNCGDQLIGASRAWLSRYGVGTLRYLLGASSRCGSIRAEGIGFSTVDSRNGESPSADN